MRRLTIEELQNYPYPNLMAEIMESGYSICTIGEHMGLGRYCENDDPEVWGRLRGEKEMAYNEMVGLMGLYGASADYLFADRLKIVSGKPYSYWRWLEHNQRKELELMEYRQLQKIERVLRENPFLLTLVSEIITMNKKELEAAIVAFRKGGAA